MGVLLHDGAQSELVKEEVEEDQSPQTHSLYNHLYSFKEPRHNPITAVRISPNGKYIALSTQKIIKIYNLHTRELITELRGHAKGISDIRFSPINSTIIASCSDDLTIRIWSFNPTSNKPPVNPSSTSNFKFTSNFSTTSMKNSSYQCLKVLKKHTFYVTTIQFNSKGNLLISGSADETITIWDIISGKILTTLAAHSDPISSLALTPDDSIIISASYDGLIRLFDLELYQCLKTLTTNATTHGTATVSLSSKELQNYPIGNVESSPNGKYILSSSLDGMVRLWDYMDNKVVKTFTGRMSSPVCERYNCELRFVTHGDKRLVISGSDCDGILCWDIKLKKIVWSFTESDFNDTKDEARDNKIDNIKSEKTEKEVSEKETENHKQADEICENQEQNGNGQQKCPESAILSLDIFDEGRLLVTGNMDGVVSVFEMKKQDGQKNGQ